MSETTTAGGERIRVLPMQGGNLKGPPCHNCGNEANYRVQFYERYGWVTRYYECGGWRCQKGREYSHA